MCHRLPLLFVLILCLAARLHAQTHDEQWNGTWVGQFPASQGDEGIEIHFQPDFAFFVRQGRRVARQRLLVKKKGEQLRLTLTSEKDVRNQAVFSGRLANPSTLVGHYSNAFLKERFRLKLVKRLAPGSP